MVALRLEELEPRLALSTVRKPPLQWPESPYAQPAIVAPPPAVAAPQKSHAPAVTNAPAGDTMQQLINQLNAGSRSQLAFFENLNAWLYLSLAPQTSAMPARPGDD